MKKTCKLCIPVVAIAAVGVLGFFAFKSAPVQDTLHGKYEDKTLFVKEKFNLLCDLLGWPIHFVKALLP